jgi:hypothetical protein
VKNNFESSYNASNIYDAYKKWFLAVRTNISLKVMKVTKQNHEIPCNPYLDAGAFRANASLRVGRHTDARAPSGETMASDMSSIIRVAQGQQCQPSAVILDDRTLQIAVKAGRMQGMTATNSGKAPGCKWL